MKNGSSSPGNGARGRRRPAMVAMAAGLVVIAGCGSSSSSSPTTSTTTEPAPEYTKKMGPMLAELVESMQVPSAVVVVRSSEFGDATFRFGSTVLGGDDLPETSDHYRIGSITKTMTATVILQLVQEGKVSLDDPISKYRARRPQRRQHHDRPAARHAQRTGRLHRESRVPAGGRRGPRTGLEPRRAPGPGVQRAGVVPAGDGLAVLEHQLHPARTRHGGRDRRRPPPSCSRSACSIRSAWTPR